MSDLSVQYLSKDHRQCESVQAELAFLLEALDHGAPWSFSCAEQFENVCCFYRGVVLAHIRKEEEVFFPVLEAYLPRDTGPLAVLRGEHREICAFFERLCEISRSLTPGERGTSALEEFMHKGRALGRLVGDHLYKEDRVLFPMVARFLSPDRDARLLEEMQAIGAEETVRCGTAAAI